MLVKLKIKRRIPAECAGGNNPRLDQLSGELREVKAALAALHSRRRAILSEYQAEVRRGLPLLVAAMLLSLGLLLAGAPGSACVKRAAWSPGAPIASPWLSAACTAARTMRRAGSESLVILAASSIMF